MAQLFPKWTNRLPLIVAVGATLALVAVIGFFWYFGSPQYTDVGYRPEQPVPYSHKLHAGDLGMDCRYCHTGVETSPVAGVPPTKTCMNCHNMIKTDSELLAPIRDSFTQASPMEWIRVHKAPDYVYFDHSAHLTAGVGCESCHGNVAQMEVVELKEDLSMGWCLECHRNPDDHLRPANELTNMTWKPGPGQAEFAAAVKRDKDIKPPIEDCSGCHR